MLALCCMTLLATFAANAAATAAVKIASAYEWPGQPQKLPFPLGISSYPVGGGPSHDHRQHAQNLANIARVVPEIGRFDYTLAVRQTNRHTHTLTHAHTHQIFPHPSWWRSNNT